MGVVAKRSSMTFFSDPASHYSHRVRIVLAEKGVAVDTIDADPDNVPTEVSDINPYNSLPTLVDRDLVLYEPNVMMEYLDERFPHPPLLPVYPVSRAECRLYIHRIQRDWCNLVDIITAGQDRASVQEARERLSESVISIAPIFGEKPYFMSEDFTLVDCCVAPILWRLRDLGVDVEDRADKNLGKYMQRVFERESFKDSLSEVESEMRE
ncbi:MAG: glutathione S-transferase N-terminal domain-containing protein [Natronospirillum sp.]|uniref:glutathione S-transferase N-terminal domain-containing protein n=1 Tax=Natronospirillum sp. TaxID=2812955 RepID=UPI0025CC84B3|nr:glutathione S-transferase N-terminal domain-containing protein [Natronospirillum sp.]MCH8550589.1 glutathione S-transferase N-terminal domain-containing protein [Natronospirillum sp.]